MPRYEVRQEDAQEVLSSSIQVPEQHYTEYGELTYKEIMDDEDIRNSILDEAYRRLARAWMKFVKDDDEEEYMKSLKELVGFERVKIKMSSKLKDDDRNVAKDVLRACMQSILESARKIDEEYYRAAIRYYEGLGSPFLFSSKIYKMNSVELGKEFEEEFKRNKEYWLGEIVEFICEKKKSATDQSLMPFISSTVLNKAKEYFLKFEDFEKEAEESARLKTEELMKKHGVQSKRR